MCLGSRGNRIHRILLGVEAWGPLHQINQAAPQPALSITISYKSMFGGFHFKEKKLHAS